MIIKDFSNCATSSRNLEYGGRAGEKKGIILNDEYWILKFPKNTSGMDNVSNLSYVTSPLSEYIGSNIYKILGYDVHDTILGYYNDGRKTKVVCACKDFIKDDKNEMLIPYTSLRNDTNPDIMDDKSDSSFSASDITEIMFQLNHNTILRNITNAKERFWDVVIIDMLINNNDRNEDNWGVIKYKNTNSFRMSPIYDCGNSFYSKTSEERIENILLNEEKLYSSAINGITAYEQNEKRIRNVDILKIDCEELKQSIKKTYDLVISKQNAIVDFINDIPEKTDDLNIISPLRKEYYIKTIEIRLEKILFEAYKKLN